MKYGNIFEMKEFSENSDDPMVKSMFKRLQETRSKLARFTEAVEEARREIAELIKQRDELITELCEAREEANK